MILMNYQPSKVLAAIKSKPLTLSDICSACGISKTNAISELAELKRQGKIKFMLGDMGGFYVSSAKHDVICSRAQWEAYQSVCRGDKCLSGVARDSGLNRSSAFRLLGKLVARGIVSKTGSPAMYRKKSEAVLAI